MLRCALEQSLSVNALYALVLKHSLFLWKMYHLSPPCYFYASAPKVPEALCFRVGPSVRPDFRPDLRPDFFVYAITQVLLDGISSNLV